MATYKYKVIALTLFVAICLFSLSIRIRLVDSYHVGDLMHFFSFAETLFGPNHFDYYARELESGAAFTYAHLPLFPYMLAPILAITQGLGYPDIWAIKSLVYFADIAVAVVLYILAMRNGLKEIQALVVAAMWLFCPWVIDSSAMQGHAVSFAVLFSMLGLISDRRGWLAGVWWGLAVATRSEFLFPAMLIGLQYAIHRRDSFRSFAIGGSAVFIVIVLPYLIRDFSGVTWAVFGHLQGRGDGLPIIWAFTRLTGLDMPDVLRGSFDWGIRVFVPLSIVIASFENDSHKAFFKVGLIFALSMMVVHSRYLLMPFAAGLAYGARPKLFMLTVLVYIFEASKMLDREIEYLLWLGLAIAVYVPNLPVWNNIGAPFRSMVK